MISVKSNNSCSDVQRLYLQQLCINYVNVCSLMSKPVNTHKFYISKYCQVQLSNLSQHCFSFSTIYRAATLGQLENTETRERKRKRERERKQPIDLENVSQSHRHTLARLAGSMHRHPGWRALDWNTVVRHVVQTTQLSHSFTSHKYSSIVCMCVP